MRVFSWDSNPSIDLPTFRLSRNRAAEAINNGEAVEIDRTSIQLLPPKSYLEDRRNYAGGGTMRSAWHIRESLAFLVWQMRAHGPDSVTSIDNGT